MFDSKTIVVYRIASRFAKWSRMLCKIISCDEGTLHNRLLELSQSLPFYVAAAGTASSEKEKFRHLSQAISCAFDVSSLLNKMHSPSPAEALFLHQGTRLADEIAAILTHLLSGETTTRVGRVPHAAAGVPNEH